jgi:two-component system, OmpR family, response regulator
MRILVIEDEPKIGAALAKGLRQESYAVDLVTDGDTGLRSLMSDPYDAAIVDRMLPKLEGAELVRQARAKGITTPILMLTAKSAVADKVQGLDAGADDYLAKPFSFDELTARVRALLRRPGDTVAEKLTVATLTMDPATHSVTIGTQGIELSKTEYALLEYLMRISPRVASKDDIISHVWDFDADILPNTVEAYIGYLRNKVDRPFGGNLIKTVRGAGYALRA